MDYIVKILYDPAILTDQLVYFSPKELYYFRLEIIDHIIKKKVSNFIKFGFYFYLEDELAYSEYENEILKGKLKEKLEKELSNQSNDDEIFKLSTLELREKMKKKLLKSIK